MRTRRVIAVAAVVGVTLLGGTATSGASGSGWQVSPTPSNHPAGFGGVAARTATDAWATMPQGLEHWDGHTWTVIPPINGPGGQIAASSAISLGPSDGWAVCDFIDAQGNSRSCAAHLVGATWTFVRLPTMTESEFITDVADVSTTEAFAVGVGNSPTKGEQTPLVLRWNGSVWSRDAPGINGALLGVSADNASDAWAVGAYGVARGYQMLAMHWDGTRWTLMRLTDSGFADSEFRDVVAFSPTDVWAVGDEKPQPTSNYRPLIAHWDGTTWTETAGVGPANASLTTIAGHSSRDLWVTGLTTHQTSTVEHFNGTRWTVQTLATPDLNDALVVQDLTAIPGGGAWAAGSYTPLSGQHLQHPLMEYHP